MTEAEWRGCDDLQPMLEFLRGKASDRKLRLFACACCRCLWERLTDERTRKAIEVAERFADSRASEAELLNAQAETAEVHRSWMRAWEASLPDTLQGRLDRVRRSYRPERALILAVSWAVDDEAMPDEDQNAVCYLISAHHGDGKAGLLSAARRYADLLREVIGPSVHSVTLEPSVLTWNAACIPRLAQASYEDRQLPSGQLDTARLAVLADALEDAGCDNADILAHCRSDGPHVRGCWVVDLLLGKE
jgi:hypothetical protein